MNALISNRAIPLGRLGRVEVQRHPFFMHQRPPGGAEPRPRITIRVLGEGEDEIAHVDVWCIQDHMDPLKSGSLTIEKARILPAMLRHRRYSIVVAFGTAGSAPGSDLNGSVVIGSKVFTYNPYDDGRPDLWEHPDLGRVVDSDQIPASLFRGINEDVRFSAEARMLRPPMRPASPPIVLAGNHYVALSNVNITNYDDYEWADRDLMEAFEEETQHRLTLGSLETTHGVIRLSAPSNTAFLYVSGIADAVGRFDTEVVPRVYAQNLVAAHNAAVVTAWLIPELVEIVDRLPEDQPDENDHDPLHTAFMAASETLTGLGDLDPEQGSKHLEALRHDGLLDALEALLGAMESEGASGAVTAHPEITRQVLMLWFAGATRSDGVWRYPSVEQHFGARMWDVIGAHPPALPGGYYGHWRYPPDNLPVWSGEESSD